MNFGEWSKTYFGDPEENFATYYDCMCAFSAGVRHAVSQITVTSDEDGNVVMVSRTDEEHRILEIIWER
jgi:hypothetical protein